MTLTLAIPVYNDTAALNRLLRQAGRLGVGDHLVVVDDASDEVVTAEALLKGSGFLPEQLTLLRNETNSGPGVGRNLALNHTATSHLLYCDSDDLLTAEMSHLLADLDERAAGDGQDFDFCLFKHHDSRVAETGKWGQPRLDEACWSAAGVDVGALGQINRGQAAQLVETANYPWNKIYRTAFLKEQAVGCSDMLVHEDVELHWQSFLKAGSILVSDRIATQHFVSVSGKRLTNRAGQERLRVFEVLTLIVAEVGARQDSDFALPFFRFASGLLDWIGGNLIADLLPELTEKTYQFFYDHISPELFGRIARQDPALALRINLQMKRRSA